MPDPSQPFNYATNLLAQTQPNPLPQAGQTLGQGVTQGIQGFLNPYQQLLQRFGVKPGQVNPNATLLPSAMPMPVGPGAPPQQPPGAQPNRPPLPGQPPVPGPIVPPGFTPNAVGGGGIY